MTITIKQRYISIKQLGEELNLPASVFRYWEIRFPEITFEKIKNVRHCTIHDAELICGIAKLRYVDFRSIKGVRKVLDEKGVSHVRALGAAHRGPKPR